LKEIK